MDVDEDNIPAGGIRQRKRKYNDRRENDAKGKGKTGKKAATQQKIKT